MTAPRLQAGLIVNALIRRVNAAGGIATILAKGDPGAGAILVVTALEAWESGWDERGAPALVATGPAGDSAALDQYVARRRARDPDLWVVELIVADAKRFADEAIGAG